MSQDNFYIVRLLDEKGEPSGYTYISGRGIPDHVLMDDKVFRFVRFDTAGVMECSRAWLRTSEGFGLFHDLDACRQEAIKTFGASKGGAA